MKTERRGWLEDQLNDSEFQRLCAREDFIEDFLTYIENEMKKSNVSRTELARRMGCKPANVTQMFRRTRNLTAATMVDIAFYLKLQLQIFFSEWGSTRLPDLSWPLSSPVDNLFSKSDSAVGPLLFISRKCAEETQWDNHLLSEKSTMNLSS